MDVSIVLIALLSICALSPRAFAEVTFSKDVAPIFYRRCVSCHRPNEIAPMSLLSYKQARPWAKAIREAILTRRMPPWSADPRYGDFVNDPRLSAAEIETIRAWVDEGAPRGRLPSASATSRHCGRLEIGQPDAIIAIPEEHTISEKGPDEYVDFLNIPTHFDHDVWITAVEVRPGNRKVVHHAHVFVDSSTTKATEGSSSPSPFERFTYKEQALLFVRPRCSSCQ